LWNSPLPEFNRHHFGHIAPKAIYTFLCPIHQNVFHLHPRVGYRIEMFAAVVLNINSVVEFNGFKPFVYARRCGKLIVARNLGRIFQKLFIF
jgi:hypothetical protein